MEVHAHTHTSDPDIHRGRKKWTHYLWEFLMLFLAVFCGFLAENQREHMVEHRREKEYIISFAEDLKQDTTQVKKILLKIDSILVFRDSLLIELGKPELFSNSYKAYYFQTKSYHFPDFIYTDRTIQQLKNSGGMRLIRNKAVADGIMDYDSKVRTLFVHQQQMNVIALNFVASTNKLFQKRLLDKVAAGTQNSPVPLLTKSKTDVEEYYNDMADQKTGFLMLKEVETDLIQKGEKLIGLIQKEYHLQ
jgi:hypothetical protein